MLLMGATPLFGCGTSTSDGPGSGAEKDTQQAEVADGQNRGGVDATGTKDDAGDGGSPEAGTNDAGANDAATNDAATNDAGTNDAGASDAAVNDAGGTDADDTDAGVADGGGADTSSLDAQGSDGGSDGGASPDTQPTTSCPAKKTPSKIGWKPGPVSGAAVPSVHCAKTGWPGAAMTAPFQFSDVTTAWDFDPKGSVDACLAAADFDGDGDVDLVAIKGPTTLAGPRTVLHWVNQLKDTGKLSFKLTTAALDASHEAGQCITADLDRDGDLDLLIAGGLGLRALRNDKGKLVPAQVNWPKESAANTPAVAVLDYDLDGDLDILTAPYTKPHPPLDPSNACVCQPDKDKPYAFCSGGFCTPVTNHLWLLRNEGDWKFQKVAKLPSFSGDTWSLTVHDLDHDGWQDVFVGNEWGGHGWLHNDANGTFSSAGTTLGMRPHAHIMGSAAVDFDRDGHADLLVSDYGADTLYKGVGDGTFVNGSDKAGVWNFGVTAVAWSLVAADLNSDGWVDAAMTTSLVPTADTMYGVVNYYSFKQIPGSGHLLRRNEGGVFKGQWLPWPSKAKGGVSVLAWAAGDLDGDGDVDLISTSLPGLMTVYRNDTPSPGHWLRVRLVSGKSAPDGEGAWVDVWSGGYVQRRYVSRSPGLNADGPYREHIGLGQVDKVDLVRVRWPSGKVSELKSPKVDSVVVLQEP